MEPYGVRWHDGEQEVDLPVPGSGSGGDRQASGAEPQQGVRKRPDQSNREAGRPEAGNGPRQPGMHACIVPLARRARSRFGHAYTHAHPGLVGRVGGEPATFTVDSRGFSGTQCASARESPAKSNKNVCITSAR